MNRKRTAEKKFKSRKRMLAAIQKKNAGGNTEKRKYILKRKESWHLNTLTRKYILNGKES